MTAVFLFMLGVPLHADTITVCQDGTCDHETIQQAVDAAVDGDRIEVRPGLYVSNPTSPDPVVRVSGKSLEIVATSTDPADTVISGQEVHRCVEWENTPDPCRLFGFTLVDGYTKNDGAGILIDAAALTVENCIVRDCAAAGNGGAIGSRSKTVFPPIALNCRMESNDAGADGGAMHAIGGFDLYECVISNNDASNQGGGLAFEGNPAGKSNYSIIDSCVVTRCMAMRGGGAYGHDATLRVYDCSLDSCTAGDIFKKSGWGGGISIQSGRLEMTNGSITDCEGGEGSGGLHVSGSTVECSEVNFYGNTAFFKGGAVHGSGSTSDIAFDGCVFKNNIVYEGRGGAMAFSFSLGALLLEDCTFTDNESFFASCLSAPNVVTAINCSFNAQEEVTFIEDGGCKVSLEGVGTGSRFLDCDFIDGRSKNRASAIQATGIGGLELYGCLFQDNQTVSSDIARGAIYIDADPLNDDAILFYDCEFFNNGGCCTGGSFFASEGGAIRVVGRSAEVSFCRFDGNRGISGGNLYGRFNISNCSMYGLASLGTGGSAFLLEGSSITDCRISGSADCNYPWIYSTGPITIDGCTMSGGNPEGFGCEVDSDGLSGCRIGTGSTIRNTRFCDYESEAVVGDWIDLGGNAFTPALCDHADVNGDGLVNGADITLVLGAWNAPCLGCASDINDDGTVDGIDLALVLGAWN